MKDTWGRTGAPRDLDGTPLPSQALSPRAARSERDERVRAERAAKYLSAAGPGSEAGAALARLTDLAARLLRTASAQVSVLTDVQHVVASASTAGEPISNGVPAQQGVCWTVVQEGAPLLVEDAAADSRVAGLPSVTSGQIGAYLGVPLIDVAGTVLGALCVVDPGPRTWTQHDVDLLGELAAPATAELQLAAVVSAYEDDRLIWQVAVDAAGVGAFDWNVRTDELRWDDRLLDLFGLDRVTFGGNIEAFNAAVHPDDLDRVGAALGGAVDTCGTYEAEYRVVLPTGGVRWIAARGRALAGADGATLRVVGAAYDTTAVREGEARVARVLETMSTAYYLLDPQWRFLYVNAEAERLLGQPRSALLGESLWELYPAAVGTAFETEYTRALGTGQPVAFDAYYPAPLDGWYEVRAWPTVDGLAVYFLEITDRVRTQERLDAAAARARLTGAVADTLVDAYDLGALHRLGPLLLPEIAEWALITLSSSPGAGWRHGLRDVACLHVDPARTALVERYGTARLRSLRNESLLARAQRGEWTRVFTTGPDEVEEDPLGNDSSAEATELFRQLGASVAAHVPLQARGRAAGMLSVFRGPERGPFSDEDLALLDDIGTRVGLAVDNARLYAEQRDLALGLQRSMLTRPPALGHLEVVVRYEPAAAAAQVGGDWYDVFVQDEHATVLVVGDVLGHDTDAAAAMGQLRSLLRGIAFETGNGPAGLLSTLDRAMTSLDLGTTATAVVARLEHPPAGPEGSRTRMRWSNAGHPGPLLLTDAGEIRELDADSADLLLGFDPGTDRSEHVITLERSSTVFFYTDGLVERRGEPLDAGIRRLTEALVDLAPHHPDLDALCDALLERLQPEEPDDDVALLAVRLRPEPPTS